MVLVYDSKQRGIVPGTEEAVGMGELETMSRHGWSGSTKVQEGFWGGFYKP